MLPSILGFLGVKRHTPDLMPLEKVFKCQCFFH